MQENSSKPNLQKLSKELSQKLSEKLEGKLKKSFAEGIKNSKLPESLVQNLVPALDFLEKIQPGTKQEMVKIIDQSLRKERRN
ncbi:hypothetical protein [Risungbinella massiliensis]|uniref:hypothetical protein n=1 Tax=Risungbinella massiliensis TaxID=1329796 RepID=UPI0005CBB0AD|nr:hypothetical protein [Risungbinella massiliensis]